MKQSVLTAANSVLPTNTSNLVAAEPQTAFLIVVENCQEKAVQMMCNSLFIIRLYEIPGCSRRSGMNVNGLSQGLNGHSAI